MRAKLLPPFAAGLVLAVTTAGATAPVPATRLQADCQAYKQAPGSQDGARCLTYIQGFLDGAVAVDKRVATTVPAENAKPETYSQRALRTRVKPRDPPAPTRYAGFCVGDPVPIATVVASVIAHLEANPPGAGETASAVVHAALRSRFPCKPPAG